MPGFYLYVSNRLEILLDFLSEVVAAPLRSPFDSEVIVVQSRGMERWLTWELAEKLGIWANGRFPFPNTMVLDIFQATLKDIPDGKLFDPKIMTWRIMKLLPSYINRPGFESLRNYLGKDWDHLKSLQLSERIADTFDHYTVYRSEMLLEWETGGNQDWQAQLWRELASGHRNEHRAAVRKDFFDQHKQRKVPLDGLPVRVSIFGISVLPPFHLEVLSALSKWVEVHLFFMNPSLEYWASIMSPKENVRIQIRESGKAAYDQEKYYETGNPLLASLGKIGRDFFGLLLDQEECEERSHFEDPGEEKLLTCLQSDILHLRDRGEDGFKRPLHPEDQSLQIHSCHSPLREMEVLYDYLLDRFEGEPDLRPQDILVMTPNIEAYAPFISAVFGGCQQEKKRIPFSIADRSAKAESRVAQSFLKILDLSGSRFEVTQVMDILDSPLVQRRFGLEPEDMDQVLQWIKNTRICWGIDGEERGKRRESGVGPSQVADALVDAWQKGQNSALRVHFFFRKMAVEGIRHG